MLKTIETERLLLRTWTLDDIDDLVEGLNNFDVAINLTTPYPYTKEHAVDFINKHLTNTDNNYTFAIQLKNLNKVIGGMSLEIKDDVGHGGIWFNKEYTGKGYGTEVWKKRANIAFTTFKLSKLQNGFFEYNEKSKHMQEKVGFKICGQKANYCPALQSEVVEIITILTKEDFNKNNQEA